MAALPAVYYRNYTSDDTVYDDSHGRSGEASVDIETLGWNAPAGYTFKEWNTARDGTSVGYQPGYPASETQYAIWEEIPSVKYLTNDQSLTAVADAIREKGGTSAQLVYPAGFISAIDAIQTGTDISDTTATAADVLSGKYFYNASGTKTQGSIASKTSSDLTSSGATVNVPAGHYASNASKTIASGSATTPATTITTTPSISVNASGLITATNSKTQSVTPSVSAGYVSTGTAGTITVNGSNTSQLATQAAQTITPGTTDQTISSGKYLTGAQTIKGDANLVAANIAKDVTIFGVTGTHEGGGGDTSKEDGLIDGSLTYYENPRVTSIRDYCFAYCSNIQTVSFPLCKKIGSWAFSRCENLQKAYFPVCSSCSSMAFTDCSQLTEVYLPLVSSITTYTFSGCTRLNTVSPFTECTTVATCAFKNCSNISVLSFPKLKSFTGTAFNASTFYRCYRLLSLYLLSNQVVTLSNSGIFNSTPIVGYTNYTSGVYGSIYVPASLLTSYQTATNWTYFSSRFVGV